MCYLSFFFFFFNDTATTEIYTLSLHDALPICGARSAQARDQRLVGQHPPLVAPLGEGAAEFLRVPALPRRQRSEEHTSELQSLAYLVCRLLLEKKKTHCASGTINHDQQTIYTH